jgi:hypothetical protein
MKQHAPLVTAPAPEHPSPRECAKALDVPFVPTRILRRPLLGLDRPLETPRPVGGLGQRVEQDRSRARSPQ